MLTQINQQITKHPYQLNKRWKMKLFNFNKLKLYKIPVNQLSEKLKDAVSYGNFGIYMPESTPSIHAWHGNEEIDYELCKELGVEVVDIGYKGGTIISSEKDLSMMIVFPKSSRLNDEVLINKFVEIISKYINNVTIDGNDILVNGEKVCGTSFTTILNVCAWTASVSFDDYSDYIAKICNKPAKKKPSYIDNTLLSKDTLEKEILEWLKTQSI